jgi:hypothetical protein
MLDEAEGLFAARRDQALRAEARATTLQASAGIAIGLVLTGSAFLIDPTKVADRPWRLVLTAVLAALLGCLAMAGYLANRATTKILSYAAPSPGAVLARAATEADPRHKRAIYLLIATNQNFYFSNFKIQQVKMAGFWFRAALACFGVFSLLLMIYAALGPLPHAVG